MSTATAAASKLIEELVRTRLKGVEIDSVRVGETEDSEGDPCLEVTVIFQARSALDAAKVASMLRHVRSQLSDKLSEKRFPIISYISKADAKKLGIEAR